MRIYRVYADAALRVGAELALSERAAHHLVKVLRHRVGDRVTLFDGKGTEATAEIISAHRRHGCRVRVVQPVEISRESPLRIELLPGMSRGEKMDLVIQKAVELGVATIQPIVTRRSEIKANRISANRLARWREIVIGACEQCGRTQLPEIRAPILIEDIIASASTCVALDPESCASLADFRPSGPEISIAIGPEGGFSEPELELLERSGFTRIGFGPRVLRTETAGIAAVAAAQTLFGDLVDRN